MIKWEWLAGFSGGNGPILRLYAGKNALDGSIFIAGAFVNYPAIVRWHQSKGMINTSSFGGVNYMLANESI